MCRHKTICGFVLLLILLSGGAICIWNINKGKTEPRIPTIYIFSDGICWDKKEHCDIITTNQGITDTIFGSIKFRGGISSGYPKHSFSLKLTEKYPLAGLKEAKSFIINATYIDKTLMRHKISYDLFRAMSPENEAAECSYANLYLNGQYEGLYVIMDKINAQRLGLDKKESMAMIFKDPPLFWGENRITPQEPDNYFQQTYPKLKKADMNAYMESFMDFLFNAPDSLFAKEIGQWIDISNVIDWHLLLLYTNNGDGVMKNFYLYKKSEQTPFRIVPWDYDHSFGRDGDNELNMLERNVDCERSILLKRLRQIPDLNYEEQLKTRWKELRDNGIFSVSHFKEMVANNDKIIREAVLHNAEKWPYNAPQYYDSNSYTQELDIMTAYIQKRIPQLDSCFQYHKKTTEQCIR